MFVSKRKTFKKKDKSEKEIKLDKEINSLSERYEKDTDAVISEEIEKSGSIGVE